MYINELYKFLELKTNYYKYFFIKINYTFLNIFINDF